MSSVKTPSGRKPGVSSVFSSIRRDDNDLKGTVKVLQEEVQQFKEENHLLKTSTENLVTSWRDTLKKVELLTDENRTSNHVLIDLLNEERRKLASCMEEKNNLLDKAHEIEEECTLKHKEIHRLVGVIDTEKKAARVDIALRDEKLAEKEVEFQVELKLREKLLEEAQRELSKSTEKRTLDFDAMTKSFDEERHHWEKQRMNFESEISLLHARIRKLECLTRHSPESINERISNASEKPPLAPVVTSANEDGGRGLSKKSRLEVARMQRRISEQGSDDSTLNSLNRLNELQENCRI